MMPSASRQSFLLESSKTLRDQYEGSSAAEYLDHRGISQETALEMGLGYVGDSVPPGLEMYRGSLAVPYLRYGPLRELSVAQIRFRCVRPECVKDEHGNFLEVEDHQGHGKMMSMAGDTHHIYNTPDVAKYHDEIAITEGEPDTWTAKQCGVPVVGIQGVNGWKDHFTELFEGYRVVWVLTDGDDAGRKFGEFVASQIPVARIIPMENGSDVNKSVNAYGPQYLLEKVGMA